MLAPNSSHLIGEFVRAMDQFALVAFTDTDGRICEVDVGDACLDIEQALLSPV